MKEKNLSPAEAPLRLAVKKQGRIELIPIPDILFIQGADNYVELVLRDGRRELYDSTLARIGAILPADFFRIHKSYLVRLSAVQRIHVHAGSHYAVELIGGQILPVGRTHYHGLRSKIIG